jgi:hypothetical protein
LGLYGDWLALFAVLEAIAEVGTKHGASTMSCFTTLSNVLLADDVRDEAEAAKPWPCSCWSNAAVGAILDSAT